MNRHTAPPCLADISITQIMDSLNKLTSSKRKSTLHVQSPKSVFARAAQQFTNKKSSTLEERQYLHWVWKSRTDRTKANQDQKTPKYLREKMRRRKLLVARKGRTVDVKNCDPVSNPVKREEEPPLATAAAPSTSEFFFNSMCQPKLENTKNVDVKIEMDFDETIVKMEQPQDEEISYSYSDPNEDELFARVPPSDNNDELQSDGNQEVTPISKQIHVGKRTKSSIKRNPKPQTELSLLRPRPHFPSPSFCFVCVRPLSGNIHRKVTRTDCFFLVRDLLEMSAPQTQHYMDEMKEPEKLIGLCEMCHYVVREAAGLKSKINKLETKLKKCQRNILEEIKGTMLTLTSNCNIGTFHERPTSTERREQQAAVAKILKFVHNRKYPSIGLRRRQMSRTPHSRATFCGRSCEKTMNETPQAPAESSQPDTKQVDPPTTDPITLQKLVASLPPAPLTSSVFLPKNKKEEKFKGGIKIRVVNIRHNLSNKSVKRHTPSPPLGGLCSSNTLQLPSSRHISTIVKQEIEDETMPDNFSRDPLSVEDEVEGDFRPQRKLETISTPPEEQHTFDSQSDSQIYCGLQLEDTDPMNSNEEIQLRVDQVNHRMPTCSPGPSQSTSNRNITSDNSVDVGKLFAETACSPDESDS